MIYLSIKTGETSKTFFRLIEINREFVVKVHDISPFLKRLLNIFLSIDVMNHTLKFMPKKTFDITYL